MPWDVTPFPAVVEPASNPTTPEKVALGELLFYDPVLGSDGETACATCHSEIWGMSDGLERSIGVGGGTLTGPGREGGELTRRNAPTLWNVGLRDTLFWDGQHDTLEELTFAPLASVVELNKDVDAVVAELRTIDGYRELFEAAFPNAPEAITATTLSHAMAAFQRTLVSSGALYDSYIKGDLGAFSDEMVEGMWVFADAGCDSCHVPPTFESERFASRFEPSDDDLGRHEVTGVEADRGAFRVPTLRNVRDSGPYFHDGRIDRLDDAVRSELALSPSGPFSEAEARALTVFIKKALVDTRHEPSRPSEVPSGLPVPLDGFRIPR